MTDYEGHRLTLCVPVWETDLTDPNYSNNGRNSIQVGVGNHSLVLCKPQLSSLRQVTVTVAVCSTSSTIW